jgi:NAD(P)H-dependent FMN reductase
MNEKPLVIAVLAGTVRDGRESFAAAQFVADQGKKLPDVEIVLVDPRDFTFPGDGDKPGSTDPRYHDIAEKADAFFIVTPEYNHSFPSSLKRMLDSEYSVYARKPVALAGASNGPWGGTRAIESLLPTLRTLHTVACGNTVYFPFVQNIFDESGQIKADKAEKYVKSVHGAYEELVWYAKALRHGRQTLPQ